VDYINNQKMTASFCARRQRPTPSLCDGSFTTGRGGYVVTPQQLAAYTQRTAGNGRNTRLGIPLVFKDNARNHVETDPRQGMARVPAAFQPVPKEAGLAAAALGEQFLKEGKATTATCRAQEPSPTSWVRIQRRSASAPCMATWPTC